MSIRGKSVNENQKSADRRRIEEALAELTRLVMREIIFHYQDAGLELPDENRLIEKARNKIIDRIVDKKIKDRFRLK